MNLTQFAASRYRNNFGLPKIGYVFSVAPDQVGGLLNASGLPVGWSDQVAEVRDWRTPSTVVASQATGSLRPLALTCSQGEAHYVHCVDVLGNWIDAGNITSLNGLVDFMVDVLCAPNDWTPAAALTFISKHDFGANKRSWAFTLQPSGSLALSCSSDGIVVITGTSSVATGFADGQSRWVRAVQIGSIVRFYTSNVANPSNDFTDWTKLGTDVAGLAGATFSVDTTVKIGALTNSGADSGRFSGRIFAARAYSAADGTALRLSVDFRAATHGVTSVVAATGQTVTINQSGVNPTTIIGSTVMRGDGVDDLLPFASGLLSAFNAKGYGALFVTCWDTLPAGGSSDHYPIAFNNNSTLARIGVSTRDGSTARDVGISRLSDGGGATSAVGTTGTGMRVLGVVVNWSAGTINLYRNGAIIASNTFAGGATSATDSLAASLFAQGANFFGGDIGRVSAFNSPLTATDIRRINQWHAQPYGITIL